MGVSRQEQKRRRRSARKARLGAGGAARQAPRLVIRADDVSLTPFGGQAVSGEVIRRLGLVEAIDAACAEAAADGAGPVKRRRRGASAGELVVALAESLLVGGDAMQDLERLRADAAGAQLRGVPAVPAASTAAQLASRFERAHLAASERAVAERLVSFDRQLGRDLAAPVTLDCDSTQVEVYGRHKPGARVNHQGQLAYQPLVITWAERGRVLGAELLAGADSTRGEAPRWLLCHALECLPAEHGAVAARFDSGFYSLELLAECRRQEVRFSISTPRSPAMWRALEAICADAWQPAQQFDAAEVAETSYTPAGWDDEPLRLIVRRVSHRPAEFSSDARARRRATLRPSDRQLVLDAGVPADELVYAYSFILTDHPLAERDAVALEQHHRRRAQIEERIKDHKLGVSLRRLPLSDAAANRVWLFATTLALNLLGALSDLVFGPTPPPGMPRRRQAKYLRRILLCVPARVLHHARQTILRLPAGLASADAFARAYATARGLAPPALA